MRFSRFAVAAYQPDVNKLIDASRSAIESVSNAVDLGLMQAQALAHARKRQVREEDAVATKRAVEWCALFCCAFLFRYLFVLCCGWSAVF